MELQEHALRSIARGWMLAIRGIDRPLFEQIVTGFLLGPPKPMATPTVPGLEREVVAQLHMLLRELGEQHLIPSATQ